MPKAAMKDWLEPSLQTWDHDGIQWQVVLRWADVDGFAECIGMEMAAADGLHVLRAAAVHDLPFGRLVRDARRARYDESWGPVIDALGGSEEEADIPRGVGSEAGAWADRPVRRRPQLDDDHYAAVARIYSGAANRRTPPRKAVAEAMHASEPTASRWIAEARSRGLLPPTSPGRARAVSPVAAIEEDQ